MKISIVFGAAFGVGLALNIAASQDITPQAKPLDPANMDLSVKPCDDFFHYANGNWIKKNTIPPAYDSWGSFNILAEQNNEVLKGILESAATDSTAPEGSNEKKIGDFYAAGMDSAAIEALGWKPIAPELTQIASLKDRHDVEKELAFLHSMNLRPVFGFGSEQDPKNSTEVIGEIHQGGIGLPDRDYYFAQDERSKKIREEYVIHMTKMFELVGDDSSTASWEANSVMSSETRLAKASRRRVDLRDPDKNYNKMSQEQLASLAPAIDWKKFFVEAGWANPGNVDVGQPEFFKEVNTMMDSLSVADWKSYFRWRVISSAANALSSPFVEESFRFRSLLTGTKEMQPRWKRIRAMVDGSMGEAVGEVYVAKAFPPEAKTRALEMVHNIKEALREHIKAITWMDDSTKDAALKKLDAIMVKIGYPDKWRDYSKLEISRSSFADDLRRSSEFAMRREIDKIGKPVDRTEWGMTPQTVNAYYNPAMNEIVFPAGILQPPFFDFRADDAVNYGGMGVVIGHEISHGFDDQGSKFDANGNLKMWWTEGTRKQFDERTAVLAKEFDGFVPIDSLHINGRQTLGENIGDLGGLSIAYTALENAIKGKKVEPIDGFTPEQRFFLSYAQLWRSLNRPERLRLQIKTDVHAPAEYRVNGPLRNLQAFYDAFGCGTDGKMYLPPDKRALIWNLQ
ncbi:MAG TPA: M13 family metallopeptidase [Bacteroidota bacterium]|nr:M13 family metallopeptidase [Bacteroidota bacterium]